MRQGRVAEKNTGPFPKGLDRNASDSQATRGLCRPSTVSSTDARSQRERTPSIARERDAHNRGRQRERAEGWIDGQNGSGHQGSEDCGPPPHQREEGDAKRGGSRWRGQA